MDMQQAIAFINDFIETEYRANIARWTEQDDQVYKQHHNAVKKFYGADLSTEVNRPRSIDARWFKAAEQHGFASATQPRQCFMIKRYHHPKLGDLFRCYVSTTQKGNTNFFSCLYVAETEQGIKIVAQHNKVVGEHRWSPRGGVTIGRLRKPIEVVKFQPPTDPDNLREYQAE